MATGSQTGSPTGEGAQLPAEVNRLLAIVEASLREEGFDFVSDEFEAVVAARASLRDRLLALRRLVWSLRPATLMLGNSTGAVLDATEDAIEDALARIFDA